MCIRDRLKINLSETEATVAALRTRVAEYQSRYDRLKSSVTVSYTHLRAHETVLELVCRLLLEIKKKWIPLRDDLPAYQLVGGVTAHKCTAR